MSPPLWKGEDFIVALKGDVMGSMPAAITGISIDSRTLNRGDAFFAISGAQFDGHDFAAAACQAGASVLVVASAHVQKLSTLACPLVIVPDVLAALEALGKAARARTTAKIIAVTGSVGKTTTKEALRHILSQVGRSHASPASFNNHWGVPLTLARLPQAADFAIFEIGMNHAGEISPLVKMVRPHCALITRVASVHSAHFTSLKQIAHAKAEIFDGLEEAGIALLNHDDEQFALLNACARQANIKNIISFGESNHADYRLLERQEHDGWSDCHFSMRGQEIQVKLGASGQHMALNMLAALSIADLLQLDMSKILSSLADFSPPPGRGARHILQLGKGATCLLLDESYNANPTSMRAALSVLGATKPHQQGRRIAVLGDMLELGVQSQAAHQALAQPLDQAGVDIVFLVGQEMRALERELQKTPLDVTWRANWQELVKPITATLRAGDVISVKSSKSTGTSHIVSALLNQDYSEQCVQDW